MTLDPAVVEEIHQRLVGLTSNEMVRFILCGGILKIIKGEKQIE